MDTKLRKKSEIILRKTFQIDESCSFWKNYRKCERMILNLSQQKEEETIWSQILLQRFSQKSYSQ